MKQKKLSEQKPHPVLRLQPDISDLHHCAAGLQAEAEVDVCAIGDAPTRRVGQGELQSSHKVLRNWHNNRAGVTLDWHCTKEEAEDVFRKQQEQWNTVSRQREAEMYPKVMLPDENSRLLASFVNRTEFHLPTSVWLNEYLIWF